ncbi:MAG: DUF302 domain-containing protein [Lentimicrobiaceae bacterium]|nr:DUF302 domain-containing protein [Lentimicrobiaceae bacterium]
MSYYFSKTIAGSFDAAVERVTALLKEEGFGVLTQINVQQTLKEKVGADMSAYKILGACNPNYAHKAISTDPKVGLLLPCNVIVRETGHGDVEVAAINAKVSLETTGNKELQDLSCTVNEVMERIIKKL